MTIKEAMVLLDQSPNKEKAMETLQLKDELTLKELKALGISQSALKYHVHKKRIRIFLRGKQYSYSVEDVVKLFATFKTKGNINPNPPKKSNKRPC